MTTMASSVKHYRIERTWANGVITRVGTDDEEVFKKQLSDAKSEIGKLKDNSDSSILRSVKGWITTIVTEEYISEDSTTSKEVFANAGAS